MQSIKEMAEELIDPKVKYLCPTIVLIMTWNWDMFFDGIPEMEVFSKPVEDTTNYENDHLKQAIDIVIKMGGYALKTGVNDIRHCA